MCVLQTTFGIERQLVTTSERLECPWLKDLLGFFGKGRDRASTCPLALPCWLSIRNSIERAPGPSKKCSKNCQSSNGSSSFSYP